MPQWYVMGVTFSSVLKYLLDLHQITAGWGSKIFPMIPGHEVVGKVIAKGKAVTLVEIGKTSTCTLTSTQ